jgi:hypothetical protein
LTGPPTNTTPLASQLPSRLDGDKGTVSHRPFGKERLGERAVLSRTPVSRIVDELTVPGLPGKSRR